MNEDQNRRAKVLIYPDQLRGLLDLPEGTQVVRLFVLHDPMTIAVEIQSPDLPEVDDRAELQIVEGVWSSRWLYQDGKRWMRWGWAPEEDMEAGK
jgi:hypothetical protein